MTFKYCKNVMYRPTCDGADKGQNPYSFRPSWHAALRQQPGYSFSNKNTFDDLFSSVDSTFTIAG